MSAINNINKVESAHCHVERSRNMAYIISPFDSAQDDWFSETLFVITDSHLKFKPKIEWICNIENHESVSKGFKPVNAGGFRYKMIVSTGYNSMAGNFLFIETLLLRPV